MISLLNLNRQHIAIKEEVDYLEIEINKDKLTMSATDVLFHISKLTALLKIHLLEEDRNLYPKLLECKDVEIKSLTNQYILEMANLVDEFTIFKCNYSLLSNVYDRIDSFIQEGQKVIKALKARISKEENELYTLVDAKNVSFKS